MQFFSSLMRYTWRNKQQTIIAVSGMSLAWLCVIAISGYVYREITFDNFHTKGNRIYRVTHNEKAGEIPGTRHLPAVGPPMGPGLKQEFSQVEDYVRLRHNDDWIVRFGGDQYYEDNVYYVDPSVLKIFDFKIKSGNASTALALPNNVVITESIARKYFGDEDAVDKVLIMNDTEWKVTAVLEDVPSNSHITFDFLLPFESFRVPYGYPVTLDSWGWVSFPTYVLLKEGVDAKEFEKQIPTLVSKHWTEDRAKKFKVELQPLKEIYFGDVQSENAASGNKVFVWLIAAAGIVILLAASFNFANIFLAMAISRAKEIGVRKMLGGTRKRIGFRILLDAFILCLCSLVVAALFFPFAQSILPWKPELSLLTGSEIFTGLTALLIVVVLVSFTAGFYPAWILSNFRSQTLLKGKFHSGATGSNLKRISIVGQFVAAVCLLSSVAIISLQINYIDKKDLGYRHDELMVLHVPGEELTKGYESLQNLLEQNPSIAEVSIGGGRLDGDNGNVPIYTESTSETGTPMSIDAVSFDFFKTIGVEMISGREFTRVFAQDTLTGVIINQAACKEFGWAPEDALGKSIRVGDIVREGKVIGVIPDFNFGSLHQQVTPFVVSYPRTRLQDVYVRFHPGTTSDVVQSVSANWKTVFPSLPLEYIFLEDHLRNLYNDDRSFGDMFRFFAVVALVIACLGLYGIIAQTVIYRTKEIGIRKVLGADIRSILTQLLREFMVLILCAGVVAAPLSYWISEQWLSEFTFRIAIPIIVFPLAALSVVFIALLAVSGLSLRAAMTNPVNSIRTDS